MVTISTETLRGVSNTIDCRVVAIAADLGLVSGGSAFTSLDTLRTLFQVKAGVAGVVQFRLPRGQRQEPRAAAERVREALRASGFQVLEADARSFVEKLDFATRQAWTGQWLDVSTWQDEVSPMMWSYRALQALSTLLVAILLALALAGVSNSFWIATRERTREIGTPRAIGVQRRTVATLFLLESGLLGAAASMSGVAAAVALTVVLNRAQVELPHAVQFFLMRQTLLLVVEPNTLLIVVAAMTATTCLGGLYPSLRAARLRPVDALAHVA